ncbi:FAD dependent oxidoreductase [Aulographum hederae CBS 113979]|uniref:FAD dependent oxidoreductase n=1 Tax=Aulographum hederae CBS 113979 TaxID=1176131 RepID=A0A6G1GSE2_9PEZI|nr:FAD dependent oxidoreductase [Aulographum hederae CBS 113979]
MASEIPESILIIGAGVFGLSTADALSRDPDYKDTKITLVERHSFPAPDGASIDTSRIIRADYADPAYASLALAAQEQWRGDFGADGRYHESSLGLTADPGKEDYVAKSLENVLALEELAKTTSGGGSIKPIRVLDSPEEITSVTRTGGSSGTHGYLNPNSGWADAEASMRYLYNRVRATNRITFVTASVTRLLFSSGPVPRVLGALLADGSRLTASLTILAAGAWTPSLLDLRGVLRATGQILAYIPLTEQEQAHLAQTPVQLNMSSGMFIIPPPPPTSSTPSPEALERGVPRPHAFLKVARHGHGYSNPVTIPYPEPPREGERQEKTITISLPQTSPSTAYASQAIPSEGTTACRTALRSFLSPSSPIPSRPFTHTRLCHYADTRSGDFILSFHPAYAKSLFVASGGNGHAFKFLPVIGERVVECLRGRCPAEFREKWAWPGWVEEGKWEGDGSRGGAKGMVLEEEMRREKGKL